MPITADNFLRHEWIGLKVEVVKSNDSNLEGKKGVVMDETKNTLVIKEEELKMIPKKNVTLSVTLPSREEVRINGERLIARPEDRIKNR
ncbi:MAG: ribonuclease P protein component 1 [Candidatus Hadarchaeia archaeon]